MCRVSMPYATTLDEALLKVSSAARRQLPTMLWLKNSLDKRGQEPSSEWVLVNDEEWKQLQTVSNSDNYSKQVLHVEYVKLVPFAAISSSAAGGDAARSAREAADPIAGAGGRGEAEQGFRIFGNKRDASSRSSQSPRCAAGGDEAHSHASRDLALAEGRMANDDQRKAQSWDAVGDILSSAAGGDEARSALPSPGGWST